MLKSVVVLTPLLALAATACVQDGAEPPEPIAGLSTERACFFMSQVNGYNEAPDGPRGDRLYVNVGARDRYLLETMGSCPDLDWSLQIGIDPVHFGVILILNLMIGLLTPPVGMVLYVLSKVADVPFEKCVKATAPFLIPLLAVLLLLTFVPAFSMWLPIALYRS